MEEVKLLISGLNRKMDDVLKVLMAEHGYAYCPICPSCRGEDVRSFGGEWHCKECDESYDVKSLSIENYELRKRVSDTASNPSLRVKNPNPLGTLSHEEVADVFNITPSSLIRKVNNRELLLPYIEVGKKNRVYRKEDVQVCLDKLFEKSLKKKETDIEREKRLLSQP